MKGCKFCPAHDKCTVTYRGSSCEAIRWSYGLEDDPEIVTNGDRIRAMTDEELAKFILVNTPYRPITEDGRNYFGATGFPYFEPHEAMADWKDWLQQPAEVQK